MWVNSCVFFFLAFEFYFVGFFFSVLELEKGKRVYGVAANLN